MSSSLGGYQYKGKTYSFDDIYNAIAYAETGIYSNPYRRTAVASSYINPNTGKMTGGSTAYGPVQLTSGSDSMIQNILSGGAPKLFSQFSPDEVDYMKLMVEQGEKFLQFGNLDPSKRPANYDPIYEYSPGTIDSSNIHQGTGTLGDDPNERALYDSVAKKIMQYELDRIGNVGDFIDDWRGIVDQKYVDKIDKNIKSTYKKPTADNRLFDHMVKTTEGINLG